MIVDTNQVTQAEAERLHKLCQECGEVIQAATKALMYGWRPYHNGVQYDNRADVVRELADVRNVGDLMAYKGDYHPVYLQLQQEAKYPRMMAHMRWQDESPLADNEEPDLVTHFL